MRLNTQKHALNFTRTVPQCRAFFPRRIAAVFCIGGSATVCAAGVLLCSSVCAGAPELVLCWGCCPPSPAAPPVTCWPLSPLFSSPLSPPDSSAQCQCLSWSHPPPCLPSIVEHLNLPFILGSVSLLHKGSQVCAMGQNHIQQGMGLVPPIHSAGLSLGLHTYTCVHVYIWYYAWHMLMCMVYTVSVHLVYICMHVQRTHVLVCICVCTCICEFLARQ